MSPQSVVLELRVSDRDSVAELLQKPEGREREEYALIALRIGLLSLKHCPRADRCGIGSARGRKAAARPESGTGGVMETEFYLPDTFPRRSPRLRQEFMLGGRRLTWASSGDRQS